MPVADEQHELRRRLRAAAFAALVAVAAAGCSREPRPAAVASPPGASAAVQATPVSTGPDQAAAPAIVAVPPSPRGVGVVEPVSGEANPQAASVLQALQDGRHPERLSLMIPPKPFDPAAFARDPQAYLDVVEPGRVFQTAQPAAGVPHLEPVGATAARLASGASTTLAVRTAPGAPVSWAALDLGSFANQLNATTVRADEHGVARVAFTATPGASHTLRVLAGSPLASGQITFVVDVLAQGIVPVVEPAEPSPSAAAPATGVQP